MRRRSVTLVLVLTGVSAGTARAQDIEIRAQLSGRQLPAAYFARIRQHPDAFRPRAEWAGRAAQARGGDLRFIAIPALFADSPDSVVSSQELKQVLFGTTPGQETLHEFYRQSSFDRLNVTGDVAPWQGTSLTLAEVVGGSHGLGEDSRVGDYLVEALAAADAVVDFSQFDNNGPDNIPNSGDDNGIVDLVAFYFAEVEAPCGGPGPWPHFSGISVYRNGQPFETNDHQPDGRPIVVDQYVIESATDCSGSAVQPISTIAHELGHVLGLPDLYDAMDGIEPDQRRWVVGCWSLMAAGGWGCGNSDRGTWKRPTFMGAWERKRLGWYSQLDHVETVVQRLEVTLPPVQSSGHILEIPLAGPESLLVEFRTQDGFDRDLPSAGVLMYRVNDTLPRYPCRECPPVYRLMLLEADGDSSLVKKTVDGGSRGDPGDAFGVVAPGVLTGATNPSTRRNAGQGGESDVNFYRITIEDGMARLVVSTGPIPEPRLTGPLLLDPTNSLDPVETEFLDRRNNANGRYDVGDLRAYLQRNRS